MLRRPEFYERLTPEVGVPARVVAWFLQYARLSDYRGRDPEVDVVLAAMEDMAKRWRRSVTGTPRAVEPERPAGSSWLSTSQAASEVGFVDSRGIRKAIAEKRLEATFVDGRWRISRESLAHFKAKRRTR
jgi:hypothetical protein